MDVLIRGKGVYKIYDMGLTKVEALSGVDFEIYSNEFLVILGPSGSGKSTFLNILGGMDTATKGEIYYKDMKLHDANRAKLTKYRKDAVGFVFQFYNLMPNLTALENVDLAREILPVRTLRRTATEGGYSKSLGKKSGHTALRRAYRCS